jgi:ComEC/Rec2-related protein
LLVEQVLGYRFRRTTLQLTLLVCFLLGVGLARLGLRPSVLVVIVLGVVASYGAYKRSVVGLVIVILFGLSLGCWRGAIFMDKLTGYQPYYDQPVSLTLSAVQDGVYGKHSQITFDGNNIELNDGTKLAGKVSVSGFGTNAVFQGDVIQISGKLRAGYGSKQGTLSFAKLTLIGHRNSLVAEIRRRFAAGMQTALPEPLGSFAMGLLIGQRATLPDSVKQDLLMVGLTHIIAVSGYNLTIMLHASRKLFANQSKRLATLLTFALIAIFLLLAGSSASIIRAAIVSTLSIVTTYYGRSINPLNLIAMAAAITAYANPFYVWSDISWYLSFLAFFGVMLLAPLVSERLPIKYKDSVVIAVGVESLCAEMMSLPIVLFTFGQMSLIGLPANMLVVALVPLAMLLATITGLAGMLVPVISGWIAVPTRVLLNYMLDIAHVLAGLPHIFRENIGLSLAEMLVWYTGLGLFIAALWYKSQTRSGIITDINDEYW